MGDNSKKPGIRFKGFTDDWEQRKLGKVAESYSGGTPSVGNKSYYDGSIPFIRSAEINSESTELFLTEKGLSNSSARMVSKGDILYALYGATSGEVGRSRINGAINQAILTILPHDGYDAEFLMQWLRKSKQSIIDVYLQGGQGNLSAAIVKALEVDFPSLAEQRQIGTYFQSLDHLITLHQRKYDKLVMSKKSMFEKMFPKNGQTKPEIRFSGFTDDWEQRKLGEIITEYKETVDSECTLPILTSSKTEGVILQEEHFGRKQQHDITGYNILPRNYCTYRNRSDGVDFTFNINKCCDKGIISKFYPVFSGKNSDVFFLSLVLNNSDEVVREIAYTCTGTGQKVLSFLDLQKMKVRVPSYDEQKEIAAYFENLDHLITLHQRELEKLKKIKLSMLEKMFV